MEQKTPEKFSSRNQKALEKYIKALLSKFPQAIVQSRCGEKRNRKDYKLSGNNIFGIAIDDNHEIQEKVKEASANINPLQEFCLCVEILLKTAEGDTLILEAWNLRLNNSKTYWDPKFKRFAAPEIIFSNLTILLKSIICVTRAVPAFKLSLGQSATSYVIMYRIYPGEPQVHQLGNSPHVNKIGEVHTPVGTISVSVAYRSKTEMTIAPQNSEKENSFMVKSDYFNIDMSPKRTSCGENIINRVLRNSTNTPCVGAFALPSNSPEQAFPELDFLQKTFLHPTRSRLIEEKDTSIDNDNVNGDLNSNLTTVQEAKNDQDTICERLTCSDISDGSDFVLIDKPPFANSDSEDDLNVFYKECQSAPSLSSFSNQPTLQEQVLDVTNQLEKFEISMLAFDNFVDSVCHVDTEA
ncbi:Autophagy-related protein 13 [Araneus ventricosus]|uniref:Autophagy-related protein 13 n=1 Tax=Araneus ventricosus TaxID=182803 RepID=A0A4Y2R4S1_ARAVE|nr:Autophagy-related protein 13 [Araneus ventricosus]GBN70416.1 Autophagy-related protein 13 [Araneus ventricosus]GBN71640.1 Autophagy-related protein 13 [Araneus ventricosus]GBN71805.1 Autophagy-related protein 13 [Araneus ventricosus]